MQEMSFEELLNQSMKEIHPGEVITGRVISVHPNYAALNIGYKADGIIKKEDYSRDPNLDLTNVLHVGDELTVKVRKLNDGEGQVVLSRRELVQNQVNDKLKALYDSKETQKGKVVRITSGGLSVEIEPEVTVFIPRSLVSNKAIDDLSVFDGKEIEFVISEFNPARNRCIGDRKKLIVLEELKKKEEALKNIKEGDIIEGSIINLLDYGAFVDLGGVDGLLHISEMGWGRIDGPKKVFKVGQELQVLIKEISGSKIALSRKFADENPWIDAATKYAIGNVVTGKVARMTEFGAFIELEPGIDALLHVSQIAREHIEKPSDVLAVGQEVTAKVVDFNEEGKKISLSVKALLAPEKKEVEESDEDVASVDIEAVAAQEEE